MKNFILSFLMAVALLAGCKKENETSKSIVGKWELRNILGGQVAGAPSTFKAGNGNIIEYTETEFHNIQNGEVTAKRTYVITKDSAEIDGTSYTNALTYDNDQLKWYFKLSGDKLMLSFGSIASDGGTLTYQKIK